MNGIALLQLLTQQKNLKMNNNKMTDEQINQRIAETCGITQPNQHGTLYRTENGWGYNCPDFCNDLNAMHEAEKVLTELQCTFFASHLRERLEDHSASRYIWHATARQRAEAFLRTLGKWEEVQA